MSVTIYDTAQERQQTFFDTYAKYRLYGGQKGGGKSWSMRAECVRQALSGRNMRGLALRRTTMEIQENMVTPMQMEIPPQIYKWNSTKGIMKFHNKSTIRFGYCRNLQDVLQYQGIEFDFICIEELTHWTEQEFKILMTSLRTARGGVYPNFFGSTNPGGKGHSWVKRLWINRDFHENEDPEQYAFISASVYDNKILLENQPGYLDALLALPEKQRRAYLEGDWDVFEGQYFPEFRRDIHVCSPVIPTVGVKRRIVCGDYGFSAPSAVYWLAEMNDGTVIIYRELYRERMTYRQLALRVKALTTGVEKIDAYIFDPAAVKKKSESHGITLQDEFKRLKMNVKGGNNSRVAGWMTFRQYLQPFEDPNSGEIKSKLQITSNCVNLIRTIPELIHDSVKVEDCDTTGDDHGPDAVRYGLATLKKNIGSFADVKVLNQSMMKNMIRNEKKIIRKPGRRGRSNNVLNISF